VSPAASPRLSVVVPSYRQTATVDVLVNSLAAQSFRDFELIVVDSSSDATTERLREALARHEWSHPPRLLELPSRASAGRQRSLGLELARADLVFTTDTDCVLPPDHLSRILARIDDRGRPLGTRFALAGSITNGTPRSPTGTASYWVEFSDFSPVRPSREGRFVPSANLVFPRQMALELGGFANRPVSDDLETLLLWIRAGVRVAFEPSIDLSHLNRSDLALSLSHQFRLGRDSARVRLDLRSSDAWIARAWPLALLPLLGWRLAKITHRVSVAGFAETLRFAAYAPWTLLTLLAWSAGFARGSLRDR
jgi:glycosyltransferase involved in cell wall biosynthesis